MASFAAPVLYTLFVWWLSTGVILYLDGLARRTFVWSFAGASALLGVALWGIAATAAEATAANAYCAFGGAVLIWGWQLVAFYMGFVTGPRRTACPPELRGWRRFVEGARTSLYHELAVVFGAGVVVALAWGQPNQVAVWAYLVFWWMHMSAKLNIFLGVPNLGEEMLPEHLRYLESFMARRPRNLLFPMSVSISNVVAALLAQPALAIGATPFEVASFTMLTTLMVLAIVEHWVLVAPLPVNRLWQFGVKAQAAGWKANGSNTLAPARDGLGG